MSVKSILIIFIMLELEYNLDNNLNNMNKIIIAIRPFPAVRVNGKLWRFTHSAKEYHNKMNILRTLVNKDKQKIIKSLLDWTYELIFYFKIPKSNTKNILPEMPHRITPDNDNCFKWFTDSLFYWIKLNDWGIWRINAVKRRWYKDEIIFYYQD